MYETVRDVAEAIAIGTALLMASLDFTGAAAQTAPRPSAISAAMPAAMPAIVYPSAIAAPPKGPQATATRRGGHFFFQAGVNGAGVPMLFDTGATQVSLRAEDATAAGFDLERLRFSIPVSTANGRTSAAPVILSSLTVGGITQRDVPALVSRPGAQQISLLGQSFTARLAGYKQVGDQLILEGGE